MRHLYVHVPFCPTICPFCNFEVLLRRAGLVDAYLDRLDAEAAALADRLDVRLDTLYLGGGTPSHLRDGELARLLEIVRCRVGWPAVEATIELHPLNVTRARVGAWADAGFTRVSLGVQSTSDARLAALGRPHDASAALAALDHLRAAAPWSLSADLITAVPGQTEDDLVADLGRVVARGVDHVSAYTLTIEPGTPFARAGVEVGDAAEAAARRVAGEVLAGHGFELYEVSNHARRGHRSAHNLGYWHGRWWAALGPGATAHEPPRPGDDPDVRGWSVTTPPFDAWRAGVAADRTPLGPRDALVEGLLAGLRLTDGVDLDDLARRSGLELTECAPDALAAELRAGRLALAGRRLSATSDGLAVLDRVVAAFV